MAVNEYPLYIIHAFTDAVFSGNAAAVCLVKKNQEPADVLKQQLATEMNLSETAYVTTYNEDEDFSTASRFGLRWFTPATEVKLCGHATLASAAVLFNSFHNKNEVITFDTVSGALMVKKNADGKFNMDFPRNKPTKVDTKGMKELIKLAVGSLPYQEVTFSPTAGMLVIRIDDKVTRSQFQNHTPSYDQLLKAPKPKDVDAVIITLKGSNENGCTYDFFSRFFTPWQGIDEDPVTGSAHTVLGPYWADILGKQKLFACQCSRRSGQLWLDIGHDRVGITGQVFTFMEGIAKIQ